MVINSDIEAILTRGLMLNSLPSAASPALEIRNYPSDDEYESTPLFSPGTVSQAHASSASSAISFGGICRRFRSFTPKELYLLSSITLAGGGAIATLSTFLAKDYSSLNTSGKALYEISIAIGLRIWIESMIAVMKKDGEDPYLVEKVMNYMARFALEGWEIVFNGGINSLNSQVASQVLFGLLVGWVGFNLTGDAFNLFKFRRGRIEAAQAIDDDRVSINQRIFPSSRNMLGQMLVYLPTAAIGITTLTLGQVYQDKVAGMELLTYCLGSLLITSGIGYFSMEGFLRLWKHYERRYLEDRIDREPGSINSEQSNSKILGRVQVCRFIAKSMTKFLAEGICFFSLLIPPKIYFPFAGVAIGGMERIKCDRFEFLSQSTLDGERAASFESGTNVKRTAVRVNQVSTLLFFLMLTGICVDALISPIPGQRAEISVLLGSFLLFGGLSRWLYHSFKPGENSRSVNEMIYRLLHNIYGIVPLYFALSTVSSIEYENSNGSSSFGYGTGLAATVLSGAMLAVNQTREFREFEFTPALFRTLAIYFLLDIWVGPIGQG